MFIGFNAALAVDFPPLFVGTSSLALWASVVSISSIGGKSPRQFGIAPYEHSF